MVRTFYYKFITLKKNSNAIHKKGIELGQEGENKSESKNERGRFSVLVSGTIPTYIMECFLGV